MLNLLSFCYKFMPKVKVRGPSSSMVARKLKTFQELVFGKEKQK